MTVVLEMTDKTRRVTLEQAVLVGLCGYKEKVKFAVACCKLGSNGGELGSEGCIGIIETTTVAQSGLVANARCARALAWLQ